MTPFLQHVARYLNTAFPQPDKVCIVFPNKRASLYLNKYLAAEIQKPVWAPAYSTISELMTGFSGLQTGEQLTLQYELYKAYKTVHPNPEPFENFYNWGLTILSDFDDIDKYQVDASRLFQNLSDLKEIDERFDYLTGEQKEIIRVFWGNANAGKQTPLKNGFLNFWQELGQVYAIFKKNLMQRSLAYEGMIYDKVARDISNGAEFDLNYDAYCFVGFNALNVCEKVLFDYFQKSGKAYFFWDYDDYYIRNTWHEAGLFLRENIKRYPSPDFQPDTCNFEQRKKVEIIAANNDVAQAKILPDIIRSSPGTPNTCVVLSDESLLVPVISSLPDSVERVNITMGYPFQNSPAYTLLELLIRLLRTSRKDEENRKLFYHREILALLRHPYMQQIHPSQCTTLINNIVSENRIYIPAGELEPVPAIHQLLNVTDNKLPENLCIFLREVASLLDNIPTSDPLDIQYLLSLYSQCNKLLNLTRDEQIEIQLITWMQFLRQLARRIKVSFIGEPLTDFQVLGVLETRLLDFDHVIMLSVNEGILPSKENGNSFIPYNLRKALGMPTIEYHDSIYAYYFYRFIQRAGKITMVYNAKSGSLQSGEMSRYLYQIKYDGNFEVEEKALTFRIATPSENAIVVRKEGHVAELLRQFALNHTFTPSSLNSWISCSLKFNFQFLEKLKEKEEVTEDVDASQFGKLLHEVMYLLYQPFEGNWIYPEDFKKIREYGQLEEKLGKAFEKLYPSRGSQSWKLSGKNLIIKEIIQKYVSKILDVDQAYAPFQLIAIEKKIERHIQVKNFGSPVKIGGYVDRIDLKDGVYRIIDYKTGDAYPNFADVRSLFSGEKRKMKDAALQCLIYAIVLMEAFPDGAIQAGLYSVRKMFEKDYNYNLRITRGDTIADIRIFKDEIMEQLEEVLNNILDPHTEFTKTSDLQSCINCSYKSICHR